MRRNRVKDTNMRHNRARDSSVKGSSVNLRLAARAIGRGSYLRSEWARSGHACCVERLHPKVRMRAPQLQIGGLLV